MVGLALKVLNQWLIIILHNALNIYSCGYLAAQGV